KCVSLVHVGKKDDAWVIIRRFDDPVEAEITQQFLRDHDVPVSVLGNSGATSILNRFTTVLDIRLTVPESRIDAAREELSELVAPLPDHPSRGKSPAQGGGEVLVKRKSAAAAFILACLVPIGGGHFYAQHTAAAAVLAAGIVGGYIGAIVGSRP